MRYVFTISEKCDIAVRYWSISELAPLVDEDEVGPNQAYL